MSVAAVKTKDCNMTPAAFGLRFEALNQNEKLIICRQSHLKPFKGDQQVRHACV